MNITNFYCTIMFIYVGCMWFQFSIIHVHTISIFLQYGSFFDNYLDTWSRKHIFNKYYFIRWISFPCLWYMFFHENWFCSSMQNKIKLIWFNVFHKIDFGKLFVIVSRSKPCKNRWFSMTETVDSFGYNHGSFWPVYVTYVSERWF